MPRWVRTLQRAIGVDQRGACRSPRPSPMACPREPPALAADRRCASPRPPVSLRPMQRRADAGGRVVDGVTLRHGRLELLRREGEASISGDEAGSRRRGVPRPACGRFAVDGSDRDALAARWTANGTRLAATRSSMSSTKVSDGASAAFRRYATSCPSLEHDVAAGAPRAGRPASCSGHGRVAP